MIESLRQVSGGVLVDIHVVPNSRKESVSYDEYTKKLKFKINSPAVEGKANKRLLEVLKDLFGPSEVVSGATSRNKTVLIIGKTIGEVLPVLEDKCAR